MQDSSSDASKADRNMQTGTGSLAEQGVVIAPDPTRSNYDIEIPWLVAGEREQPQALDNLDMTALRALLHHPWSMNPEPRDASVLVGSRMVESREHTVFAQSVPCEQIISGIVENIGKYTGIVDMDGSISRAVYRYLENRCYGRRVTLSDHNILSDLKQWGSVDFIARYLSQELMKLLFQPTCVKISLNSTEPFTWMHDVSLFESSKTIFPSVATVNDFEREFAAFLDCCEDVVRFTSLAVADQRSLVIRARDGSPLPSMLRCDPDWVVVSRHHGGLLYWLASTKDHPLDMQNQDQFMAAEWCKIATKKTGQCWRYIHVNPERSFSEFPSFQSLNVHHISRDLAAFRAAQKVPTSLAEMLQVRDEGRRSWSS